MGISINEDVTKDLEIKVVAPAGGSVNQEKIDECIENLKKYGYQASIPYGLLQETLFCSNTDEYRLKSIMDAFYSEAKIIIALRGGYGSSRILKGLLQQAQPEHQKFFIGYSDITLINIFLYQIWHWDYVIHGPVFIQTMPSERFDSNNVSYLFQLLKDPKSSITINDLMPLNKIAASTNGLVGKITGGNLSVLQTTIGTEWEIITKNHVLVLEDVSEAAYSIDRMLQHFFDAGKFDNITALVFGEFYSCPNSHDTEVQSALLRIALLLEEKNIPVLQTSKIGHGKSNYPFIYGSDVMIINDSMVLNYKEEEHEL